MVGNIKDSTYTSAGTANIGYGYHSNSGMEWWYEIAQQRSELLKDKSSVTLLLATLCSVTETLNKY